jgi:hypothetical protein
MDFKNLSNNQDENLHENILRENKSRFSRKLLQKSRENLRKNRGENLNCYLLSPSKKTGENQ